MVLVVYSIAFMCTEFNKHILWKLLQEIFGISSWRLKWKESIMIALYLTNHQPIKNTFFGSLNSIGSLVSLLLDFYKERLT